MEATRPSTGDDCVPPEDCIPYDNDTSILSKDSEASSDVKVTPALVTDVAITITPTPLSRSTQTSDGEKATNEREGNCDSTNEGERKSPVDVSLLDCDDDDDFVEKGSSDGGCTNAVETCEFVLLPCSSFFSILHVISAE